MSVREACPEVVAAAPPPASALSVNEPEPLGLAFGEESEEGSAFAPFRLVQEYLYTHLGQSNEQKVHCLEEIVYVALSNGNDL